MGNNYLWHPYKTPAVAGSSHNPAPRVKLEPPTANSSDHPVAELENRFGDRCQNPAPQVKLEPPSFDYPVAELENSLDDAASNMDFVPTEPQLQQLQEQLAMAAAGQPVPDPRAKWNALVGVCSFLFEKLLEAEKAAMINAGEMPVAQNVTIEDQEQPQQQQQDEENGDDDFFDNDYSVDDDDDDDDADHNLVIDEDSEREQQSEVALRNAQRASVIIALPPRVEPSTGSGSSTQSDSDPMPSTSSGSGSSASTRSREDSCSISDSSASGPYPKRRRPAAVRRPKHMSQLTLDPSVPFQVEVRYQKNMARNFPGTENRTPEQQALRARNTLAARQSRAKLRVMDEILQQEAENEKALNEFVKERLSASFTYANTLRELQGLELMDFMLVFEAIKDQYVVEPLRAQHYIPRGAGPPLRESPRDDLGALLNLPPPPRRFHANFDDGFAEDYAREEGGQEQDAQPQPGAWANFAMGDRPNFNFGGRNF